MKNYQSPALELILLLTSDVLTFSGDPDELPDDEWEENSISVVTD